MVNSEGTSGSIADGFVTEPAPRSPSGGSSADRSPPDLNNAAEDLSDQLKNVGLDEVASEQTGTMMTVFESNGGIDSNAVDENQEEEEDEEGRDSDGDGRSESESESEIKVEKREAVYPLRSGAEDCSFYMRTGSCKYGSSCKFNHPPLPIKIQISREKVREKEDDADKLRMMDCKYFFRTGGCKYGETCRFNHTKPKSFLHSVPEFNFLGLPIRPGEVECPYYMRHGSCKYGAECKFNHPDPKTIGGSKSPSFHGNNGGSIGSFSPKSTFQQSSTSWSSSRHVNGSTPFIPAMLSQTPQSQEWNGYQGASRYSSERSVYSPSTTSYLMNNTSAETSIFSQYQHQMPAEEFPERPDQPECSYYIKTGDCKFKFNCKYHHPKNRLPKQPPYALNDKGLPLRPDQNICTHYSRYGICKFGPACRFDHSVQPPYSTGSSQAVVEPPQVSANGNESEGWN